MPDSSVVHCSWVGCEQPFAAKLQERPLCMGHFLQFAHGRVATIQQMAAQTVLTGNLLSETRAFLSDVISQTAILATQTRLLATTQRDDLMQISKAAVAIYQKIQREVRTDRRVPCLLRAGRVSETCFTVNISPRGACVEIAHPLTIGQRIVLERIDTKRSVQGLIAWMKPSRPGKFLAGVEILNEENFWVLDG